MDSVLNNSLTAEWKVPYIPNFNFVEMKYINSNSNFFITMLIFKPSCEHCLKEYIFLKAKPNNS